ncbi:MAG: DUF1501 domain-containing protein [Phycisphaerales bacterium]|nr:MAG: DUF1501 domain-containing protein [Phycisphaerales bacterium]
MNRPCTRREFVHHGLGLLGLGATAPAFLTRTVFALDDPRDRPLVSSPPGRPDDHVLVVLQLAGGNDGLNTVVPHRNDDYYRARPRLSIDRRDVLRLNDELGFHPSADGLKRLYDDGLLAVVQGVGYPNPNRSHFVSTEIWETGDPTQRRHTGWVGRYFDACCAGADPPDPKLAVALTREAPAALEGGRFRPVAFTAPDQLRWKSDDSHPDARLLFERLNGAGAEDPSRPAGADGAPVSMLDYVRRAALNAQLDVDRIREAVKVDAGKYRSPLEVDLAMVAQMISAGLPTRVYYVSLSGFDTHSGQLGRHAALMGQLGRGLTTFFADLQKLGVRDRVLLMTFSEFGRRVAQNASGGTDHGQAAPLFMAGTMVRGGLHGRSPSLRPGDLSRGDVTYTVDFRNVYAAAIADWLGGNAEAILGKGITPMKLLKI